MTAAVAAVLGTSGCTSAERVHLAPSQPPPSRPPCTGGDGEAVFRGLLVDLNYGRQNIVSKYFTPADRFVRWIDPGSDQVLTELPDPADGHPALDTLRDRLNALAAGGFLVTIRNFIDTGHSHNAPGEEGGTFQADLYGRGSAAEPLTDGTAVGTVDCQTGKLRVVQVDRW